MEGDKERMGLLRSVTFNGPSNGNKPPTTTETLVTKVFGTANAPNQRISESLDYEPVQNKIFYERMKAAKEKRHLFGYTGHTLAKFVVTISTGIITGTFAVLLGKFVGSMFEWKNEFIQHVLDGEGAHRIWVAFLWHVAYSCFLVIFAVALVQYWAPQAAGAGVTLVMAYLNGNHVPNLLRLRTLITKFVGTVCSVGAGLPMGPEGPMVHIGACVASVITYAQCNCIRTGRFLACFGKRMKSKEAQILDKLKVLDDIVSDADHREFISAGTSAGISAAFGAPIGGVLFAMEEACSFWSKKTGWRCFVAAVVATYTMAQLNNHAAHGMIGFSGVTQLENKDWFMQLPFIVFNAGMAGLLGAGFNSLRMWLWKVRASKTRHVARIFEVVGLVLLCQISAFFFSWAAGKCIPKNPDWGEEYGLKFLCKEEGHHNDLATLFLSSSHHTIVNLFSLGKGLGQAYLQYFTPGSLALFTTVYLVLMSIGAGVAIPGGLFMPSIMVGASWGVLWGSLLLMVLPNWNIQPGLYGLMAATGVLGGVFRSSISLVVLVVEGTHGMEFMSGVILSVVVANWVAHHIHHDGVYESELERIGNLYFLRDEPPHRLHTMTAEKIMAAPVIGFQAIESVGRILEVLRTTSHNGFPVFNLPSGQAEPLPWSNRGTDAGAEQHGSGSHSNPGARDAATLPSARSAGDSDGEGEGEGGARSRQTLLKEAAAAALTAANGVGGVVSAAAAAAAAGLQGALAESGRSTPAPENVLDSKNILEGLILRSQLLVLLQRRHFCDAQGHPIGREFCEKVEIELESEMRTFYRRYFTHNRYVSATATPLDALQLDSGASPLELSNLYLDLRPYMNRSPFTVHKACSASRAHQAFLGLSLRHLIVVDTANRVAGIITRKDLDHAAGHGWWRMSAPAPKPKNSKRKGLEKVLDTPFFKRIHSVPLLNKLVPHAASSSDATDPHQPAQQQQQRMSVAVACASGNSTPRVVGTPLGTALDTHHHSSSSSSGGGAGGDLGLTYRNPSAGVRFADQPNSQGSRFAPGSQSVSEQSRLL